MHSLPVITARNASEFRTFLNIGLSRSHLGLPDLDDRAALHAVRSGWTVGRREVFQSDTEKTLVVEVFGEMPEHTVARIAVELDQEAIAAYVIPGIAPLGRASWPHKPHGFLAGPKAEAWGKFDPKQFLMLDGSRLEK